MAAAEFSETRSKLSRYVGSKVKGAAGARAVTNLEHLDLKEPAEPIRVMKTVTAMVDGKYVVTKTNEPVLSD